MSSANNFLQYEIASWEPDTLILPLSLTPYGPLFPVNVKKWFIQSDPRTVPVERVSHVAYAYVYMRATYFMRKCVYAYQHSFHPSLVYIYERMTSYI